MLPATVSPAETPEEAERQFPHLTAREEAFVVNYVACGGNGTRAAKAAGYAKAGAHVQASRMLRKPAIAQAIMECAVLRQASMVPAAQDVVATLMHRSKSDYVRLEAAKDVQSRAGLQAPQRVQVSGGVSINIDLG